ncbi:DNA-binding MarR family transcriptional regulator [Deinobacterium chartae]|uniref:DNA-binding MarR family transcriptional regulator n=1 Tax=Deinobacterium chartae TaxID=521158 RepID=A0A841HZF5_9DEIO|nr:helix-turn-helix domain-containing protein [Deinobacterium chartae]MBB6098777.1 DNA-binding MarR family transcriptional regulator [Deinobacterium chartae]
MTPASPPPTPLEVTTPAAREVLLDPRRRRFLLPFLAAERSVGEAARDLRVKPNTMYRRVTQLLEAGLLVVSRSEARGGRLQRRYRAAARNFFVPFHDSPHATVHGLLEEHDRRWQDLLNRGLERRLQAAERGRVGYLLEDPGNGELQSRVAQEREGTYMRVDEPDALSGWSLVYLTAEQARELGQTLRRLEAQSGRSREGRPYLLRLAVAPAALEGS